MKKPGTPAIERAQRQRQRRRQRRGRRRALARLAARGAALRAPVSPAPGASATAVVLAWRAVGRRGASPWGAGAYRRRAASSVARSAVPARVRRRSAVEPVVGALGVVVSGAGVGAVVRRRFGRRRRVVAGRRRGRFGAQRSDGRQHASSDERHEQETDGCRVVAIIGSVAQQVVEQHAVRSGAFGRRRVVGGARGRATDRLGGRGRLRPPPLAGASCRRPTVVAPGYFGDAPAAGVAPLSTASVRAITTLVELSKRRARGGGGSRAASCQSGVERVCALQPPMRCVTA